MQHKKLGLGISCVFGLNEQGLGWGREEEKTPFLFASDAQFICGDLEYRHEALVSNERLHIAMSKLWFGLEMKRQRLERD